MAKTIKQRLDDLENNQGDLPILVFEQTRDDENLFYLTSKTNRIMRKVGDVDKKDLYTRAEAEAMAGNANDAIFIVYKKDWRARDND